MALISIALPCLYLPGCNALRRHLLRNACDFLLPGYFLRIACGYCVAVVWRLLLPPLHLRVAILRCRSGLANVR